MKLLDKLFVALIALGALLSIIAILQLSNIKPSTSPTTITNRPTPISTQISHSDNATSTTPIVNVSSTVQPITTTVLPSIPPTTVATTSTSTTTASSTTSTATSTTTVITETAKPVWNEQLGVTLSQSSASLAYNVTAVAQTDQDGCGPVYLVNGVSDKGYWYQVGLGYDWGCNLQGFWMIYQIFPPNDTTGNSGAKGAIRFNGIVSPGDKVLLDLLPDTNGTLIMQATDWNTGATAETTYSFENADVFIGSLTYERYGYFSGLMTEWERPVPYYGGEQQVIYSEYGNLQMKGYLFAFGGGSNNTLFFYNNTSDPSLNAMLSSDGTEIQYFNGTTLITGNK